MRAKSSIFQAVLYSTFLVSTLAPIVEVSATAALASKPLQPSACNNVCDKLKGIKETLSKLEQEMQRLQTEIGGLTEACGDIKEPPPLWKGDISFVLTWVHQGDRDPLGPDIDIWVKDPKGNRLSSSSKSRMGPTEEGGSVDLDDEAGYAEKGDVAKGAGPERVYWPKGRSPTGNYEFGCRFYEGNGSATCTIDVYIGNKRVLKVSDSVSPDKKESRTWTVENADQSDEFKRR